MGSTRWRKIGRGHDCVIGSVAEVLLATTQRAAILAHLAAPSTHIVTFTVTEKGYCRAGDGSLDLALAQAASTRCWPMRSPAAAGIGGLTLLSCDNLADNGHQLRRLMGEYLAARHPDLLDWGSKLHFPCSMVDRIVPATTDEDRARWRRAGLRDEGVVMTEPSASG
jgi:fructuronate reductase